MGYDLTLDKAKGKTWIATLIESGLRGHGSKGGHAVEYDGGGDMGFFFAAVVVDEVWEGE